MGMAADPVTTGRRPARVMTPLTTTVLRTITTLKIMTVRRVTMLRDPSVRTRRLHCALPATCGSTVMTESTDTARCLLLAALTGSRPAIMADASSPGTGAARGASPVVTDSAAARAFPAAMSFMAARSAAELSGGTISGAARAADIALRETITSAVEPKAGGPSAVGRTSAEERRACDLPAGSLILGEDTVRMADTPVADVPVAD